MSFFFCGALAYSAGTHEPRGILSQKRRKYVVFGGIRRGAEGEMRGEGEGREDNEERGR